MAENAIQNNTLIAFFENKGGVGEKLELPF